MIARFLLLLLSTPLLAGFSAYQTIAVQTGPDIKTVGVRPSFIVSPVLGTIDALIWKSAPSSLTGSNAIEEPVLTLSGFGGVGFPDIRTYLPPPSRFAEPGPWAPLVAWRELQDEQQAAEPIAHVRCMGLSPQELAQRADLYLDMIYGLAEEYELNALLLKAVIAKESCFNSGALSKVGAQGLMQLMPETATWLKVTDPHDPEQNLKAGVRYLAWLHEEFQSEELALAAYNAGPGNVRRYKGVPPFAETQAYVSSVQANLRRYKAAHSLRYPDGGAVDQVSYETMVP